MFTNNEIGHDRQVVRKKTHEDLQIEDPRPWHQGEEPLWQYQHIAIEDIRANPSTC